MALFAGTNASEAIRPDLVSGTVYRSPAGARPSGADDVINGGGGDDSIASGGGNDVVVGGTGDDEADLGSGDDIFRSRVGDGYDRVEGGLGFDSYEWRGTEGADAFEFLKGATGVFLGEQADGVLKGFERVKLSMGAGADKVVLYHLPSTGLEQIDIDAGTGDGGGSDGVDTILLDFVNADDTVVVSRQNGQFRVAGSGPQIAIDNLETHDIVKFTTRPGNDTIDLTALGAGAPVLRIDAGGGNDLILPGLAAETIAGGLGDDTISYAGSPSAVIAGYGGQAGRGGWAEGDILSEWRTLAGSEFHDTLGGTSGTNVLLGRGGIDTLWGGAGDDILNGGSGNDTLFGEEGEDRMVGAAGDDTFYVDDFGDSVVEAANGGNDHLIALVTATLSANVERLSLYAGVGPINGFGNALANEISGNHDGNILSGRGGRDGIYGQFGNDVIDGEGGADRLFGGGGDDRLSGGIGSDLLNGGGGRDLLVFDAAPGAGNVDTIEDFTSVDDTIYLETGDFGDIPAGVLAADALVLGTSAQDAEDRIIYHEATGRIFFDADGVGGAAAVLFARVEPATELDRFDFRGF